MFHARYHEASKIIAKETDKAAAEDAASKKRKSEDADADFNWAQDAEAALGKLMPTMKSTITAAELIETKKKTLQRLQHDFKWHTDKAAEQQMELQNEVMQADETAMTESGERK